MPLPSRALCWVCLLFCLPCAYQPLATAAAAHSAAPYALPGSKASSRRLAQVMTAAATPTPRPAATSSPTPRPAATSSPAPRPAATTPATSEPGTTVAPTATPTPPPATISASSIRYEDKVVVAEGTANDPVRFNSQELRLRAEKVWLDVEAKRVRAHGYVVVERDTMVGRSVPRSRDLPVRERLEPFTIRVAGSDFWLDTTTQEGAMEAASALLPAFNLEARRLEFKGRLLAARDIRLTPGGLSEEERRVYGTPPFNLRAKEVDIRMPGSRAVQTRVRGAALYYNNRKLLPLPSQLFSIRRSFGSEREDRAFTLTPRISYSSGDGLLVTARLRMPLAAADRLGLTADIGASTKVGFRGGASLEAQGDAGSLLIRGRVNDIVTTQLTSRIVLDRLPDLEYTTPVLPLFSLPGGRRAGIGAVLGSGRYAERNTGGGGSVRDNRHHFTLGFTSRVVDKDGPYIEVFSRRARYTRRAISYRNLGYEIGYDGRLGPRVQGLFSFRTTDVDGTTPFRFDQVEIARELRTTFDVLVNPRYLVPIDLRYDLDRRQLRDRSVGLLRNFKNFAYGASYHWARQELKFDVRLGF